MKKEDEITQEKLANVFEAEKQNLLRYAFYRLGNKDDAEDVLQDTFLKMHQRLSNADGFEICDLRSYLFRTLTNVCAKWQLQNNRIKTTPINVNMEMVDMTDNTSNEMDYRRIVKLLLEIPEEQAEVIRLRIYGNNSFAEIAEILSLPLPTVKSRFLYGLEKIRRGMKQKHESI